MCAIYGADRWERAYGAEPSRAWADAVGHCTLDDIARGIGVAESVYSQWLPTLGQFRAWCRKVQVGTFSGSAGGELSQMPRLEDLGGASASGQQWLAYMRFEGLVATPPEMPFSAIEDALEGADVQGMRDRVERETKRLRARSGWAT